MISYKHKCIFVHIPKTGESSIEKLLWPSKEDRVVDNLWKGHINSKQPFHNKYQGGGLQHLLASQIRQEVGEEIFDSFFKFTIVRNPWDKAVSHFAYIQRRPDLLEFIGMKTEGEFKTYLSLINKKKYVQWEPQFRFFLDEEEDKQIVDYIGRFEEYQNAVKTILQRVAPGSTSFSDSIPHEKKGRRAPYQDYYDLESIEMVRALYQKDIDLLGYTF